MLKNSLPVQFLLNPFTVGAVCPSSKELACEITSCIGLEKVSSVAELGPGTGALTGMILEKMSDNGKFFAVELNESVIEEFRKKFPKVTIYNESAVLLKKLALRENLENIDVIVSGLPWASFPSQLQDDLLDAILETLPSGGVFTTFAYLQGRLLPAGKRFRKKLDLHFSRVEKSRVIWKNIPPAFIYRCWK